MFDVGFTELLLVGIIALVVVGPERLPGLMRTLGLWVGRARAAFSSLRDEVEREVRAEGLRDTERAIRDEVSHTEREFNRTADDVRSAVTDASRSHTGAVERHGEGETETEATGEPAADDSSARQGEPANDVADSEGGTVASGGKARRP